jgi:hypothetical protein
MDADRQRIRGINEALPPGERILWEGAPDRGALARHAFHARKLAVYFTAVILLWTLNTRSEIAADQFRLMLELQVGLALAAIGFSLLLAYLAGRTTIYAITDRRVVMKIGIVLPMTVNIPLSFVEAASTRMFGDGTGQIALQLRSGERLAYLALWPHARPWRLRRPEPLLRGLTDAAAVGEVLRQAALGTATSAADATARSGERDATDSPTESSMAHAGVMS